MSTAGRETSTFDECLLLAEALERALRNRTDEIGQTTPAQAEVASLVEVARRVETSSAVLTPNDAFRAAARTRLVAAMRETSGPVTTPRLNNGGIKVGLWAWLGRTAAVVSAVALSGAATATASASALPGDVLYPIKQMTEQVALASARDEAAHRELLAEQAQTRLDETSRLLEQGRADEADRTAERYAETVEHASVGAAEPVDARLRANRARLTELLENAPPQARRGLERALVAAEGGPRAESPRPATDSESRVTSPPLDKTRPSAPADAEPEAAPTPSPRASGPRTTPSRQEAAAVEHTEARRAAGGSPSDVKRLPPPAVDRSTTSPTTPGQTRRSNRP